MRKERSDLAETVSHNQTGKLLKPEHKKTHLPEPVRQKHSMEAWLDQSNKLQRTGSRAETVWK
jgi:hypothetical protein